MIPQSAPRSPILPAGTRIVLEIPKPGGGFCCVTPTLEEFVAALLSPERLSPQLLPAAPEALPDAGPETPDAGQKTPDAAPRNSPSDDAIVPVCSQCKRAMSRSPKGLWTCTPCRSAAISQGWASRRRRIQQARLTQAGGVRP